MSDSSIIKNHAAFIWSVADLLRGDYKQSEYGRVIMPLTVLRRLDCVLDATKPQVLERHAKLKGTIDNIEPVLEAVSGEQFFNTSPLDFRKLLDDPGQIAGNLRAYIAGFSASALPHAPSIISPTSSSTALTHSSTRISKRRTGNDTSADGNHPNASARQRDHTQTGQETLTSPARRREPR